MVVMFVKTLIYNSLNNSYPEMGGKNMKNNEWKEFAALARAWTSTTEESTTATVVNGLLDSGDVSRADRESIVNAVKAMMKGKDNNPFGRRGRQPAMSAEQTQAVIETLAKFGALISAAFDADTTIAHLVLPNGRSKVKQFPNGTAYAEFVIAKAMRQANELAKAGTLDEIL